MGNWGTTGHAGRRPEPPARPSLGLWSRAQRGARGAAIFLSTCTGAHGSLPCVPRTRCASAAGASPQYPRLLGHLHMLIAMSGYLHALITGAMFGPSAFAYLGENGWIRLYLCRADVTGCYFQPGCHGNNQASAPVSSSIYNLLILFHLSD